MVVDRNEGRTARRAPSAPARWLRAAVVIGALACAGGQGAASAAPPSQRAPLAAWRQVDALMATAPAGEAALDACLRRAWVFVQEESSDAVLVYRPADYPLGPSRGRFGYEFLADGQLISRGIGPADGPLTSPGEWGWVAPGVIRIMVNDPQGAYIDETLRIVSCDAETLLVERLPVPASGTPTPA